MRAFRSPRVASQAGKSILKAAWSGGGVRALSVSASMVAFSATPDSASGMVWTVKPCLRWASADRVCGGAGPGFSGVGPVARGLAIQLAQICLDVVCADEAGDANDDRAVPWIGRIVLAGLCPPLPALSRYLRVWVFFVRIQGR